MAPDRAGSWLRSAVLTRAAAARAGPAGSRVAAAALTMPGLGGCRLGGRGQAGHGVAGEGLAGLGMATPQRGGLGQPWVVPTAGLGLVGADQPRGRGDGEQPGDHHHADDQRPPVRPPAAGEPRVVRVGLGVGLDTDADQPQRLAVFGDAGRCCCLRPGRAVPGIRRAFIHPGLICRRLIHGRLTCGGLVPARSRRADSRRADLRRLDLRRADPLPGPPGPPVRWRCPPGKPPGGAAQGRA